MSLVAGMMEHTRIEAITANYVVLAWDPPSEPNGIVIHYSIQIEPLSHVGSRRPMENVLSCYTQLGIEYEANITELSESINITVIPYTLYRVRISASTIVGAGNFSEYTLFSTLEGISFYETFLLSYYIIY